MRRVLPLLVLIVWSLWFGGMIGLFLFVQTLFRADRAIAVEAAPRLFAAFELYGLLLGAAALVLAFSWQLLARSRWIVALFTLLGVASVGAVVHATFISPKMHALGAAGQSGSPQFRALHGRSMMVYSAEALALLAGGVVLGLAMQRPTDAPADATRPDAAPGTATASPLAG